MSDAPSGPGSLQAYEAQLEEVQQLLLDDPENAELQDVYESLLEVVQLMREVHQGVVTEGGAGVDAMQEQHGQLVGPATVSQFAEVAEAATAMTGTADKAIAASSVPPDIPSLLPPQVAEQIRHAQQRAALKGQGPSAWAIGAKCRAVYSGDGNWYNAVVEGVGASGISFVVMYDGYGTREEVGKEAIQLHTVDDEAGYKGVAPPKRRRVDDSVEIQEMPKWLEIKPTDDEKTKQKKRKLAKAHKSKARFARLDLQQKQKAEAWKAFLTGKTKGKNTKAI